MMTDQELVLEDQQLKELVNLNVKFFKDFINQKVRVPHRGEMSIKQICYAADDEQGPLVGMSKVMYDVLNESIPKVLENKWQGISLYLERFLLSKEDLKAEMDERNKLLIDLSERLKVIEKQRDEFMHKYNALFEYKEKVENGKKTKPTKEDI